MRKKRLGLCLLLLIAGIGLVFQLNRNAAKPVWAAEPAHLPSSPSTIFLPVIVKNYSAPRPLWRYGVDQVRRPISAYNGADVVAMRLGWYIDFGVTATPEQLYGMEYMPTVRMKQWKRQADGTPTLCCVGCGYLDPPSYAVWPSLIQIQAVAASRPGMTWIVGNEVERIDWTTIPGDSCASQDEMVPEVYAEAYHDVYSAIKSVDPTAQVAMGALVQPSPLRLKYLERVWAEYTRRYSVTMPVDVWNIHVYVYTEEKNSWGADIPAGLTDPVGSIYRVQDHKNFNIAAQMLVGWRTWMRDHGQQNKPLITSEYGVVFPEWVQDPPGVTTFSPTQVRDEFMYPSFNYFSTQTDPNLGFPSDGYRLIQRWAWFSMDYDDGGCEGGVFYPDNNSNLFYSGLGPSSPPTNCPYPSQGTSPFWTFWTQYVQPLPAGGTRPYAPARASSVPEKSAARATVMTEAANVSNCSDSPAYRDRLLQTLPDSNTPEGRRVWLSALSKLTSGTRICLP